MHLRWWFSGAHVQQWGRCDPLWGGNVVAHLLDSKTRASHLEHQLTVMQRHHDVD